MYEDSGGSFATLTHARLRAAQGDIAGAKRILRVILDVQPGHDEARELLARIEHRSVAAIPESEEAALEPVRAATAGDLAVAFRGALAAPSAPRRGPGVLRLFRWLQRVERNRAVRHVR